MLQIPCKNRITKPRLDAANCNFWTRTYSKTYSRRPLDAAQTVYFTIYYELSWDLGGAQETARCCSNREFYQILSFPGLGGALETARCCSSRVLHNTSLTFPGLGGATKTARCCSECTLHTRHKQSTSSHATTHCEKNVPWRKGMTQLFSLLLLMGCSGMALQS